MIKCKKCGGNVKTLNDSFDIEERVVQCIRCEHITVATDCD